MRLAEFASDEVVVVETIATIAFAVGKVETVEVLGLMPRRLGADRSFASRSAVLAGACIGMHFGATLMAGEFAVGGGLHGSTRQDDATTDDIKRIEIQ